MKILSLVAIAALSVAGTGCKKKSGDAPDCAAAIHHSMDLSKAEMAKMGADDKMLQKMTDVGIQHCKDDKWPAAATTCMVNAPTMEAAKGCYDKLTPEQTDKMNKAAMELMTPPATGSAAPAAGSAEPAAGSAAPAAGSAAPAAGSAAPAAGSAVGSGSAG